MADNLLDRVDSGEVAEVESTDAPDAGTPPLPQESASGQRDPSKAGRRPYRRWPDVAVVVVIVIVLVGALYFATGIFRGPSNSSTDVLTPAGTLYTIPVGQSNSIIMVLTSNATVNGTISEVFGLQLYLMTPTQYQHLLLTNNISGYEWTQAVSGNDTVYNFDLTVAAGDWDLIFANPNGPFSGISTLVGFLTNLVLLK